MATVQQKRIWGWMSFDWAQQPFYTLGLTFIFGPYFASVATTYFLGTGLAEPDAKANAQSLWTMGQTVSGLIIAFSAPFLGAYADLSGRKIPWIAFFSAILIVCSWSLWFMTPDGANIILCLVLFYVAFIASESALNFINAILPSLGDDKEVGRISGSASACGYWGGVLALFIILLFFEDGAGQTLIGLQPLFGLDAAQNEGTRAVGPFIAIWFAIFMIPFFLWVRDDTSKPKRSVNFGQVITDLKFTIVNLRRNRSLLNFLVGSMLYRDALNALYAFGGVYATLVLDWKTMQVGIFGIIAAIAAAIITFIGGRADKRYGPKVVIRIAVWVLIAVCITVITMTRENIGFIALPTGSIVPDVIFYICGAAIGGAGGALYAASRSMMVRHTDPQRPAEAFGLFALTGKATAFLAPLLITIATFVSGNTQIGFAPLIVLFLLGLLMLRWVKSEGDRAAWSAHS